ALQDVDVNRVVKDSTQLLLPQFSGSVISFDMKFDQGIQHILMDEGMLQQVLLNLFLNAKDAMEGGGIIRVETSEIVLSEQDKSSRRRKDDTLNKDFSAVRSHIPERAYIKISVTDTGKGIAQSDIDKIFDPFFTTKDQGKGTGLGLTLSLGIIQAYGGDIKVKSELGKGTTFEVILPCSRNL
ncbi:MAG: hypothetical protein HY026_02370, partial [Deltaproteobacteria bacterium]|nr:hypothetical protein [Deltaproteobacteria bacterium]